jgi:transposase-like protein
VFSFTSYGAISAVRIGLLAGEEGQASSDMSDRSSTDFYIYTSFLPSLRTRKLSPNIQHNTEVPPVGLPSWLETLGNPLLLPGNVTNQWFSCTIASHDNPGRRKRVVSVPVPCPHCHSTKVIKAGKQANGAQRYQCQTGQCARRSFLLQSQDRGRAPEIRRQVIHLALNGSGIRDTTRVLPISPRTVIAVLKKSRRAARRQSRIGSTSLCAPIPSASNQGA